MRPNDKIILKADFKKQKKYLNGNLKLVLDLWFKKW